MSRLQSRHLNPPAVLVVEDNPLIRFTTAEGLRECGWTVFEAETADEAIAILQADSPVALVFSDIEMPGTMDGLGLAQWVRANRPSIRVMLTSGRIQPEGIDRSLCDEGPIPKPYLCHTISDRIRHHLRLSGTLGPRFRGHDSSVAD